MKWRITYFLIFAAFVFVANANAALVDNGNGTITDTNTNLMWLQDVRYTMTSGYDSNGRMTWYNAVAWADQLSFADYDDWRLPATLVPDATCDISDPAVGFGCRGSELGYMNYVNGINRYSPGPFQNMSVPQLYFWSGTEFSTTDAYYITMSGPIYEQDYVPKSTDNSFFAWAVRDINVVPEPISSILFVTGGSLLVGWRFLKSKNRA